MRNNRTVTAQTRIDAFKSIYRELYAVCLLICSNENSAQAALLDVLLSKETHINRKKAFQLAVSSALKYPQEDAVLECLENVDRAPELANEQPWARRAVMLICACDLSFLQTAKIVGVKASEVRSAYARALACVRGSNETLKRKELKNICRAELKRFGYAPDLTVLRRAVEN
ncbi:MAG: hypothetical protein IJM56_00280, partial [Clostridia bacterium]|nr:hypothetical protein [Clostridia bacterium]